MSTRVAIVEAKRTPIGKFLGAFANRTAVELGTDVSKAIIASAEIESSGIDEVYLGHARQAGNGPNPARQVAIAAGLSQDTPAYTINVACGSGLKSIALGFDAIRLGNAEAVLAGGIENMTQVPFMLNNARLGYRLGHAKMIDGMYADGFVCRICDMVMGETVDHLADEYDISRREQDEWAAMSQNRSQAARARAVFEDEIVAVTITDRKGRETVVSEDEHPRNDVTADALGKLPTVFRKEGTVTAGNASGITDGAAAVILMSEDRAKAEGKQPLGFIKDFIATGVDPKRMGIGPVPAMQKLFKRNGIAAADLTTIELNEAFAAQVLACQRELKMDVDRINPNGGSISLGHPIGCTGARIVATLLHEMKRSDGELGVATLCVSGGLGMAMLIERG